MSEVSVEKLVDVPVVIQEAAGRVRDRSYPAARHQYRIKGSSDFRFLIFDLRRAGVG